VSTCKGAPPPHYPCPHGAACDWIDWAAEMRRHSRPFDVIEPEPPKARPVPPSAGKRSRVTHPDPLARRLKAIRRSKR
jgi:hypothetical protein